MAVIKLTDGVLLDQSSVQGLAGIDFDNLLYQVTDNATFDYTATEDCWVVSSHTGSRIYSISGQNITSSPQDGCCYVMLKKGQKITEGKITTSNYGSNKVFGLKK